jgi:hypothetical protein
MEIANYPIPKDSCEQPAGHGEVERRSTTRL